MTRERVCTVTTLKDTPENARVFVRRNLAAGADHMFVFIDDVNRDLHEVLSAMPHVTVVRAGGRGWWGGAKPRILNDRQFVNAGVVNFILAGFEEVAWLFHLDGDECLDIDKDFLLGLGESVVAVSLRTLESVAKPRWDGEVDRFKHPPGPRNLSLLSTLGVIDAPELSSYYHGHIGGKVGIRPSWDRRLGIHRCIDHEAVKVDAFSAPELRVLHYESYSGEEFVRKWTAHLSSGPRSSFSGEKDVMRRAIAALVSNDHLTEQRRDELLMKVFEIHIQDDVDMLEELGLLVSPAPERHDLRPFGFDQRILTEVERLLELVRGVDKRRFSGREPVPHPARAWLRSCGLRSSSGTAR